IIQPPAFDWGNAHAGDTLPDFIQVAYAAQVGFETGQPIPDLSFYVLDSQSAESIPDFPLTTPPKAECTGGYSNPPKSGADGVAHCDLHVSSSVTPGTTLYLTVWSSGTYWSGRQLHIVP